MSKNSKDSVIVSCQ